MSSDFILPTREDLVRSLVPPPVATPLIRPRWAIVRAVSPLRVQMIGDATQIEVTPETLVSNLAVNDRVWTALTDKGALIVVGRTGGHPNYAVTGAESAAVDWDTLDQPGFWPRRLQGSQTNGPGGSGYYYVQTYTDPSGTVTQFGIPHTATDPLVWRSRASGVWTAWNGSGLPTTGSNSNGTWVKYPDGLLTCQLNMSISLTANTVATHTWTFPEAFVTNPALCSAIPSTTVPQNIDASTDVSSITTTDCDFKFHRTTTNSTMFDLSAIGRWK